jgi:RND family efflux transporter MFP subunit
VLSSEHTVFTLSRRDGLVMQLSVQEGARVSKGDELARMNDEDLRAQLRQTELDLERTRIEERQYEAEAEVSRTELEQEKELLKEGLTSKRQVDRVQYRLQGAREELEKARLAKRAAQARVDAVRIEIDWSVIRAPIEGVVTRRYVQLGGSVVKNEKLFEIAQLEPLEVKFQLPFDTRAQLKVGSPVGLSLIENDRIVAQARIRRIDPVADAMSNTRGYVASVIGKTDLLVGAAVNVRLSPSSAAAPIWIPRAAFPAGSSIQQGSNNTLFVLGDGKCAARTVIVQSLEGDQAAISSGLTPGDRVILLPPASMKSGDAVVTALR